MVIPCGCDIQSCVQYSKEMLYYEYILVYTDHVRKHLSMGDSNTIGNGHSFKLVKREYRVRDRKEEKQPSDERGRGVIHRKP